ncbi:MAG: hypothetical protein GY856_36655 [bacterium]|nr:hypothetical protein [bacterium]
MTGLADLEGLVARRYGLVLQASSLRRMHEAAGLLSRRLRLPLAELIRRTESDPALLRDLAGHLTVEESYFFRQQAHYDYLIGFLRERLGRGGGDERLRIWSAGCSGGEEPYTLAILMLEHLADDERRRIEVFATDINRRAIDRARAGVFRPWSLRDAEAQAVKRHFQTLPEGGYQLREDARSLVTFHHLSVQEQIALLPPGSLDVILFRNVAIYLDQPTIRRLYQAFARTLKDRGLLVVSSTDPRPPRPPFETIGGGISVFRLQPSAAAELPLGMPLERARLGPPRPPRRRAAATPRGAAIGARFEQACTHADRGDYARALALTEEILAGDSTFRPGYLLRAQLRLLASEGNAAVADLRRVLFLDPTDGLARYWYAMALRSAGRPAAAMRQAKTLIAGLGRDPGERKFSVEGAAAGELLRAATALKEQLE